MHEFWTDELTRQTEGRHSAPFVVSDWKTPSGRIHVGALRGVLLHDAAARAIKARGHEVRYIPIDYAPRVGKSSIRPVRDTLNFFSLIVRTILYFRPLKIFVPASAAMFALAIGTAIASKFVFGQLADVTAVTLASASLQLLAIGMLADLIDKRWPAPQQGAQLA